MRVPAQCGGDRYCRCTVGPGGIDSGATIEQQADLGGVVRRPHQRGGAVLIRSVYVGADIQEQTHRCFWRKRGGVHERCCARRIMRIRVDARSEQAFCRRCIARADTREQPRVCGRLLSPYRDNETDAQNCNRVDAHLFLLGASLSVGG